MWDIIIHTYVHRFPDQYICKSPPQQSNSVIYKCSFAKDANIYEKLCSIFKFFPQAGMYNDT
jgi:hypothetical protein